MRLLFRYAILTRLISRLYAVAHFTFTAMPLLAIHAERAARGAHTLRRARACYSVYYCRVTRRLRYRRCHSGGYAFDSRSRHAFHLPLLRLAAQ